MQFIINLIRCLLIISMLLIRKSMDLWKLFISSLCTIDKLSFPSVSIFNFLLWLPISSSVSQIIKELCSSSSYSFYFRHLLFNGIMKEAISSQNMNNQLAFLRGIIFKCPLLSYNVKNLFISYFLSPFYLLHSPPAPHSEALQILAF